MKKITSFLIIFFLVAIYPIRTYSAEILQIKNSSSILVGDQNRDLPIKLFCVEINNDDDEQIAICSSSSLLISTQNNLMGRSLFWSPTKMLLEFFIWRISAE